MKYKIVIIAVLLVVIILVSLISYFFIIKPPPITSEPPPITSEPPPITSEPPPITSEPPPITSEPQLNNIPKDAICSSNGNIIDGKTLENIESLNQDDNYNFDIISLGKDIKTSIEKFMFPERFTLPPSIIIDKNLLLNDEFYTVGTIKEQSQIKTITPSINGGKNCLQFPSTIYKKIESCPVGQERNTSGSCSCLPIYQSYIDRDIPGFDIGGGCLIGMSPDICKKRCDDDPNCKAYNEVKINGAWGTKFGCCLKSTEDIPTSNSNKIDYYRKIETVKDTSGNCKPICSDNSSLDNNGNCSCNPGYTKALNKTGKFDPCYQNCPLNATIDGNGNCNCNLGYTKAPGKTGRNDPCYQNCPLNSTMDSNGNCSCNLGYTKAPGKTGRNDPCYENCKSTNATMDSNGNCSCNSGYTKALNGFCYPTCNPNTSTMDSIGNCICNSGYVKSGDGQCNKPCGVNEKMSFNGECSCNDGYTRAGDGSCYPRCTANAIMGYNGQCNCIVNHYKQADGSCKYIQCTNNTFFDPVTQTCKSLDCGSGGFLDTSGPNWFCRCSPGYSMGPSGKCDQQISNFIPNIYSQLAFNNLLMQSGAG